MDLVHHYDTPLGGVTAASDGEALIGLWFDDQKYFAASLGEDRAEGQLPVFDEVGRWLDLYFAGRDPGFVPKLDLRTTAFRRSVCGLMLDIPYGRTATYGGIARYLASRTGAAVSAQAVGGAVAHNPVSLIIPCHRVIGADGALVGYAGGLDRKLALLRLEKSI